MQIYYDFHMHTALSPCGDNEMTPHNIVNMALLWGLEAIAITDHNSCGNCAAVIRAAAGTGLTVVPGMELCTAEEAHVVCLFAALEGACAFDRQVTATLPPVRNRAEVFGEQRLLNAEDDVVGTVDTLLLTASGISVDEVAALARSFGGTAFPAHIDRPSYSVTAVLGDIPDVGFPAVEISYAGDVQAQKNLYAAARTLPILRNSDAHSLEGFREPAFTWEVSANTAAAIVAAIDRR